MFDDGTTPAAVEAVGVVARFGAVVDELIGLDRAALSRDELLALVRGCEQQLRRLPVVDHHTLAELEGRGVAAELACRDTTSLLRDMLRLSPGEARARVCAAQQIGPRPQLSGAVLPPLFPAVAAAQADGTISPAHARVILAAVDALPEAVADVHGDAVEAALVQHAGSLDPTRLQTVARRVIDTLDPDGTLAEDRDHQRRRMVGLRPNRDGTGELTGHLTPACLAVWQTVLDSLSAPQPAEDGDRDTRTPGQRAHDGLADAGQRLLRDGGLPDAGGIPATVLITMTATQWQANHAATDDTDGGHGSCGHADTGNGEDATTNGTIDGGHSSGHGRDTNGQGEGASTGYSGTNGQGGDAAGGQPAGHRPGYDGTGFDDPTSGDAATGEGGGYATTGHGGLISIPEAMQLAGEAQSSPSPSPPPAGSCPTAGPAGAPPPASASPSPPATAAVAFRPATSRRAGHRPITSSTGPTAARQMSTT